MPAFHESDLSTAEMNDLIWYLWASRFSGPPYRPFR